MAASLAGAGLIASIFHSTHWIPIAFAGSPAAATSSAYSTGLSLRVRASAASRSTPLPSGRGSLTSCPDSSPSTRSRGNRGTFHRSDAHWKQRETLEGILRVRRRDPSAPAGARIRTAPLTCFHRSRPRHHMGGFWDACPHRVHLPSVVHQLRFLQQTANHKRRLPPALPSLLRRDPLASHHRRAQRRLLPGDPQDGLPTQAGGLPTVSRCRQPPAGADAINRRIVAGEAADHDGCYRAPSARTSAACRCFKDVARG